MLLYYISCINTLLFINSFIYRSFCFLLSLPSDNFPVAVESCFPQVTAVSLLFRLWVAVFPGAAMPEDGWFDTLAVPGAQQLCSHHPQLLQVLALLRLLAATTTAVGTAVPGLLSFWVVAASGALWKCLCKPCMGTLYSNLSFILLSSVRELCNWYQRHLVTDAAGEP